jgi:hypothetical protein
LARNEVAASEHPGVGYLDRLSHEYSLKDTMDGA